MPLPVGNIVGALTTSCNTQSSAPEDGQNNCPVHVELTGIIYKPLLLHLVGSLFYLYEWCTVKQISDNEIYLLIKYIKSIIWRLAKRLPYIEDARVPKGYKSPRIFKFHFNFLKFPILIQVFIIFIICMRVENLYQLKNLSTYINLSVCSAQFSFWSKPIFFM